MADRKMRMMTDNHGRMKGISYIHECMGGKGIAKNPAKSSWPQKQYLCNRCPVSLNLPTVMLSLILKVYKFFLKQY
jgi:hypothetical protein